MKKVSLSASALVAMITLSACGGSGTSGSGDENTLTAWAWNINIPVLEEAASQFAEEHPDFELEIIEVGTPDVYQRITTGLQANGEGLPDIMLVEDDRVQGYLSNFSDAFLDISEYGFDTDHHDKFPSFKTELLTVDGGVYGFPFDAGPAGVFYRTDLFEDAGIDVEQIHTWDDFIEAGHTLRDELDVALTGIDISNDDGVYRMMLNQQGTFYFDENEEINLASDESIRAMEVVQRLHQEGLNENLVGWDAWLTGLANGNVATAPTGAWLTGSLTEQAPDLEGQWGVMPLPAMEEGGNQASNLGGSNYMISAGTNNPELAYDFMEFFSTTDDVQLTAMENGLFPSLNTIYEDDVFTSPVAYFGDQAIWELFAGMMDDIPAVNYTGNYSIARDETETAQSDAANGADVSDVMTRAEQQLQNRIN
ncbi:sugar ABC transporter substrate-binding protein [Shouchella sp. 1P09AA]|uniref:ABC transporter substrate-binding protein n=1 Tax=unclassified Shouchella TaxID=2893065 RepID=UPI0039A23508